MGIDIVARGEDNAALEVGRNHTAYERRGDGLYLAAQDYDRYVSVGLSIDDIPKIIEKLQEVYDEFEANKPAPEPTLVAEILDPLPDGSVIRFNDEPFPWVKIKGTWTSSISGTTSNRSFAGWNLADWPVHVEYTPEV